MIAVIYARYSAGPRQTDQSIEGQVRVCTEWAEAKGWTISEVYADAHISGRTDNRPRFQQMIKDAEARKFDALIIYKTDRLSRDRTDSAYYKKLLRSYGVQICYAAEPIPEGPAGVILEGLLESMAEFYSLELAEKIKRGMTESAHKCKSTGGTRTFGFTSDADRNIIIKEDEAKVVRAVFEKYASGESIPDIRGWLDGIGARTTRGQAFTTDGVARMLKNRKYLGEYKYEKIIVPGGIPAIVSQELFIDAQAHFSRRGIKMPKAEYLLSQKAVCGLCGAFLQGVSGTGRHGEKHFYYYCANSRKGRGCPLPKFTKEELEGRVLDYTRKYIAQEPILEDLTEKLYAELVKDRPDWDREEHEKAVAENLKAQRAVADAIASGVDMPALREKAKALTLEAAKLAAAKEAYFKNGPKFTKEQIRFMLDWTISSNDKHLLKDFVSEVRVYPDKLLIIYNILDKNDEPLEGFDILGFGGPYRLQVEPWGLSLLVALAAE